MKEPLNERERLYEAVLELFNKKGIKFTMDDIAKELGISKKTIYTYCEDKETLFLETVDYCFDGIKEAELAVAGDDSLTTLQKLEKILGVMPDQYKDIDFGGMYMMRDKYPKIYRQVALRLESGWDVTISLIQKGIDEGVIRNFSIPIFKAMLESSLERFFQQNILYESRMTYQEGLEEVIHILMYGIIKAETV